MRDVAPARRKRSTESYNSCGPRSREDVDCDVAVMSTQQDIDAGVAKLQPADTNLVQKLRQARGVEDYFIGLIIEFEPEACLQHGEGRGARPGLRRTGHRIICRPLVPPPHETAEQLGQAPLLEIGR